MNSQGRNETDFLLAESFKELVKQKPVEKITIKDITDRSGVIRPTFYNHYQDKYELLEFILRHELFDPMQPLVSAGMTTEAVMLLFTNIEKDKEFYIRLHKMDGPFTFHQLAERCVEEMLLGYFSASSVGKTSQYSWLTPKLVAKYYSNAMSLIVEDWIDAGMSISPREMGEAFQIMITSSMEDIVKRMMN